MGNWPPADPRGVPAQARPAVRRAARRPAGSQAQAGKLGKDSVFRVGVLTTWKFLKTQPASFWLINVYMFFEYVRPASIWTSLDILPWTWLSIVLCVTAFLMEGQRIRSGLSTDRTLLIFTGVLLASCVVAYIPSISFGSLGSYLTWVLIYFLITGIVSTEKRFLIFMLAFLLYNMKMAQNAVRGWAMIGFGWSAWGATGGPGWFQNSGEFGIEMTVFFPLSLCFWLALRKRWGWIKSLIFVSFPVSALMGMIASSSRGAVVGGAAVGLYLMMKSRYKVRTAVVASIVAFLAVTLLPEEQLERFDSAGEDETSTKRLTLWKNGIRIANANPVLGIGFKNWMQYYRDHIWDDAAQLPHNIFIEAWAELGYLGLFAFLAMIVATLVVNHQTRRLAKRLPDGTFISLMATGLDGALIGLLVSGFFVTVLYYPFFWINLAMTSALHYAARYELRAAGGAPAAPGRRARGPARGGFPPAMPRPR